MSGALEELISDKPGDIVRRTALSEGSLTRRICPTVVRMSRGGRKVSNWDAMKGRLRCALDWVSGFVHY
jgi:hypothetical protein